MCVVMDIVVEDGFGVVIMVVIVDCMGFVEGMFYWYFKSKDVLLIVVYCQFKVDVFECVLAEMGDSVSVKDWVWVMWLGMWNIYCYDLLVFIFGQCFGESVFFCQEGGVVYECIMDYICLIIEDGQVFGEICNLQCDVLVVFFFLLLVLMLKQINQGKVWFDIEIDVVIDVVWQVWLGQLVGLVKLV